MAAITVNDSEKFNRKSQSITITQNGYPDRSQYMIQTTLCVILNFKFNNYMQST